jgi:hypothetical protein
VRLQTVRTASRQEDTSLLCRKKSPRDRCGSGDSINRRFHRVRRIATLARSHLGDAQTKQGSWHLANHTGTVSVFGVGFLLMVSLLVSTVLAAFATWFASDLGAWQALLLVIDVGLSLVVSTVLFALVYKYLPLEQLAWRGVWVGSLVTAVLFNIGKFAIGYYLGKSAFASVYGAEGPFSCYCCGRITPPKSFSLEPNLRKAILTF